MGQQREGLPFITMTFIIAALLFALTGCGQSELNVDLRGQKVVYDGTECSIGHAPVESLKMCGFPAEVQAKALGHLAQYQAARLDSIEQHRPNPSELEQMARVMYTEAPTMRLMSYVGSAVIERKQLERFPSTIRGVAQQRWAFEGITRGAQQVDTLGLDDYGDDNLKWHLAVRTAWMTLTLPRKYRPLKGVDHFWSPKSADGEPDWAEGHRPEYVVGDEFRFYSLVDNG